MLDHIIVPLDESELAEKALEYATHIVAPNGTITLLSVVNVPEYITAGLYPVPMEYQIEDYEALRDSRAKNAKEYLTSLLPRLEAHDVTAKMEVHVGDPAECIVEVAKQLGVDAIVMSTHGRSGISRWIFGSVTQKVLSATPCPVLVIPSCCLEDDE